MTKDLERMLGLDAKEARVFSALSKDAKRVSDIEKALGRKVPRTTIVRILSKLHKRGLAAKHKFSARRGGWVQEDMDTILQPAKHFFERGRSVVVPHREHEVVVYRGKEQMLELADKIRDFKKDEKIYWILPSHIWDAWNSAGIHKRMVWVNSFIQKRNIIVDAIVSDTFLVDDLAYGGKKMLEGYLQRPAVVHAIPKEYLNFSSDIMIFRDRVSIMNWKDEIAVEVRNRDLVNLFKGIISYIHTSSRKINLHTEAEKLLSSL